MRRRLCVVLVLLCACRERVVPPDELGAVVLNGPVREFPVISASIATSPIVVRSIVTRDGAGKLISPSDGSGQVVHPSVTFAKPNDWSTCRMGLNAYPNSNSFEENPAFYWCKDSITIVEVPGIMNPLMSTPSSGNNSDDNVIYDARFMEYVYSNRLGRTDSNIVNFMSSAGDKAFEWTKGILGAWGHELVSQALVLSPDGKPELFAVNAGVSGCGSHRTKVEIRKALNFGTNTRLSDLLFGAPAPLDIVQPGYVIWHWDGGGWNQKPKLRIGLITAHPDSSKGCLEDDLFLTTSVDGVVWRTYRTPIMWRDNPWAQVLSVYKSTYYLDEENDLLRVWMSVCRPGTKANEVVWELWYASYHWSKLYEGLESQRLHPSASLNLAPVLPRLDTLRQRLLRGVIAP